MASRQRGSVPRYASNALRTAVLGLVLAACRAQELPYNVAVQAECCGGKGMCLPPAFLDAQALRLLGREACAEPSMCVPDLLRKRQPLASCHTDSTGAEGRCLPSCLPAVQARAAQLAVDGCEPDQRCVPCYDPITGESTQACDVMGDHAVEKPETFASCCEGIGRCVPGALVPDAQRSLLGADSCRSSGELCAPLDALMEADSYRPMSCTTAGFATEGRCVPDCLPTVAAQKSRLGSEGCGAHFLCAPCFDPLSGESSGACALGADRPEHPKPEPRATCCSQLGHCLPQQLLKPDERAQLGIDTCRGTSDLCVPDAFAASDFAPAACSVSAAGGAEGRCLPDCVPQVAGQRDRLRPESCGNHELCVPCTDPVTGMSTGACALGSDKGPKEPLFVFENCCGGQSRCVPRKEVPEAQRNLLGRDSCRTEQDLCVPTQIASEPAFVPSSCTVSDSKAEGRCLLRCLPPVAERASVLKQDGCPAEHACVPCFDPASGQPTGACALPADKGPKEAPTLLPSCCGELGRCTPKAWLPAAQASAFGPDSCADPSATSCVAPAAVISDAHFVPSSCVEASTKAEGRCVPACLPALASRAQFLSRGSCPEAHLCAPCFDPITGKASGACSFPADPGPAQKPLTFESCCGSSPASATGLCVPASLLPKDAPELPAQSCKQTGYVCAPRVLVEDPKAKFPTCSSLATNKGVCIESCYLPSIAQAVSFVGSCAAGQLCVDCSLLGNAIGGCAP